MRIQFLILLLTAYAAWATVPTNTVVRSVRVDTNGVLTGSSTNFAAVNGLATTDQVAAVAGNFTAISNLAASALATGVSAQATADSAMATGAAAIAALSGYAPTGELAAVSNLAASAMATGAAAQVSADAAMSTGAAAIAALSGYAATTGATFSGRVSAGTITNVSRIAGADPSAISIGSDLYLIPGKTLKADTVDAYASAVKFGKPLDVNGNVITNSGGIGVVLFAAPVAITPGASFAAEGYVKMSGLPTSDPSMSGFLWNSNGYVVVSP